jgi:hypothetical protein
LLFYIKRDKKKVHDKIGTKFIKDAREMRIFLASFGGDFLWGNFYEYLS